MFIILYLQQITIAHIDKNLIEIYSGSFYTPGTTYTPNWFNLHTGVCKLYHFAKIEYPSILYKL